MSGSLDPYATIAGGAVSGSARIEDHAAVVKGAISGGTVGALSLIGTGQHVHRCRHRQSSDHVLSSRFLRIRTGLVGAESVAGASAVGGSGAGGVVTSGSAGNRATAGSGGSYTGAAGSAAGNAASAGSAGSAASAGSGNAAIDYCSPRPGLLFCDNFEKAAPGSALVAAPWSNVVIGDGTIDVDASVHHGGSKSVHVNGSGYSTMLVFLRWPAARAVVRRYRYRH